jgi:hypothetical protein
VLRQLSTSSTSLLLVPIFYTSFQCTFPQLFLCILPKWVKPIHTQTFFSPPSTVPSDVFTIEFKPSNLSKTKMLSNCIQEMNLSNLGWDTDHTDWFFPPRFPQSFPGSAVILLQITSIFFWTLSNLLFTTYLRFAADNSVTALLAQPQVSKASISKCHWTQPKYAPFWSHNGRVMYRVEVMWTF